MNFERAIKLISEKEPEVQAVYLFGSFGTEDVRPDSDVDLALLLPHGDKRSFAMSDLIASLAEHFGREIDLINLRTQNTVFQKEIIAAERRIYCADSYAADEFEMLVISAYQKLNEERREIIEDGLAKGRFVA